jgi:hypothetical protein
MEEYLRELPLVDAHCHSVTTGPVDAEAFERWCTEATVAPSPGTSYLDSQLGFALRRWCARTGPASGCVHRGVPGPAGVARRWLALVYPHVYLDVGLRVYRLG